MLGKENCNKPEKNDSFLYFMYEMIFESKRILAIKGYHTISDNDFSLPNVWLDPSKLGHYNQIKPNLSLIYYLLDHLQINLTLML